MGFLAPPSSAQQAQFPPITATEEPNRPTDSLEGEARDTRTVADIRRATEEANTQTASTLATEDESSKTLLGN
jgi:hypothetical protein